MKIYFLYPAFLIFLLSSCSEEEKVEPSDYVEDVPKDILTYNVYLSDDVLSKSGCQGWGYDIFLNGTKWIHQYHMPGIPGLIGFETKEDAEKAAKVLIDKANNNQNIAFTEVELVKMGVWHLTDTIDVDGNISIYRSEYDNNCGCKGWGYWIEDRRHIQPHLPAVGGLHSFRSKEEALVGAKIAQQFGITTVQHLEENGLLDCE